MLRPFSCVIAIVHQLVAVEHHLVGCFRGKGRPEWKLPVMQ
jgi:hypothetical protein